jgi:hypothetical protein
MRQGNASAQQLVSVAINNLDEVAPSITSADTAVAIDENTGAGPDCLYSHSLLILISMVRKTSPLVWRMTA